MSKYKIGHFKTTVTIANGEQTANGAVNLPNGIIRTICIDAPALTSANYQIDLTGPASSMTLFEKASLSPNAVSVLKSDGTDMPVSGVAVDGSSGVSITTGSSEGAQRIFTIDILYERG